MSSQVNCFLIDNDVDDQEIFCLALQEIDPGITCTIADNGVKALEVINSHSSYIPTFIFMDLNMPLMNGKQCLEELRKIDRISKVPIYIYSTAADPRSIADVKQSGATDFIVKPASFKELTELLATLLQNKTISYETKGMDEN